MSRRNPVGRRMRAVDAVFVMVAIGLVVAFFFALSPAPSPVPVPQGSPTATQGQNEEPTGQAPPYVREAFGDGWASQGGCDTRNLVLARDLTNVEYVDGSSCLVQSGDLIDPYTGEQLQFQRGTSTSSAVQIDHVVSLSQAWRAGAWRWDDDARVAFANDPRNLLAVDGPLNASKSDKGPAEFGPQLQGEGLCTYVAAYLEITQIYSLRVEVEDLQYAADELVRCNA